MLSLSNLEESYCFAGDFAPGISGFCILEGKRQNIESQLEGEYLKEYQRIRQFHTDAAVQVVRGSCKGYKVPAQILVELRNNEDKIFIDENSGRILIPEEIHLDEDIIDEIVA